MKKLSEVFRIVGEHLGCKASFVCGAIDRAQCARRITSKEARQARAHIDYLIFPHFTVLGWVSRQIVVEVWPDADQTLNYRKRWVAHIVKTLERRGK